MILNSFELAAQRAFGTKVPSAMANSGRAVRHSRTIGPEGFSREASGANLRPIAEEFTSRRPF
jgi:hypothetical protein